MTKAVTVQGAPGCGKTRWLTKHLTDLVQSEGSADGILVLSFTKASAQEIGGRNVGLNCRTIHSYAYGLVSKHIAAPTIVGQRHADEYAKETGFPLRLVEKEEDRGLSTLEIETRDAYQVIGYARGRGISLKAAIHLLKPQIPHAEEFITRMDDTWEAFKSREYLTDFNDILKQALDLLLDLPGEKFKHLVVDEGQDLTPVQWNIINVLTERAETSIVAGDSDQALFTWNGAVANGMSEFARRFDGEKVELNRSWRVPKMAMRLAGQLIGTVKDREPMLIKPNDNLGTMAWVNTISQCRLKPEVSTLVLGRTYLMLRAMATQLNHARIPFHTYGRGKWIKCTTESKTFKILLTIERICAGAAPTDQDISLLVPAIGEKDTSSLIKNPLLRHWMDYRNHVSTADFNEVYLMSHDNRLTLEELTATKIELRTIHSAKGAEADVVVLSPECSSRVIHNDRLDPDVETRTFFVALTRTKNATFLLQCPPKKIPIRLRGLLAADI